MTAPASLSTEATTGRPARSGPLRPFRFGVQARTAADRAGWVETARAAEDLGYAILTMPDHLDDQLSPVPALATVAAAPERLRIGFLVLGNDYRHPAFVAKDAATLDLLSDGRLELGLGAGWMRSDYDQAGLTLDPPGTRIERLVEAVAVMDACLSGQPVTHQGRHYQVEGLVSTPLPVQRPRPPLLIGGGGPRMLRTAGRLADIVGVNPDLRAGAITVDMAADVTRERVAEKVGWVREGAGDRFADIELQVRPFVVAVTNRRRETAEKLAGAFGITADEGLASPLALVGSVDQIADDLRRRREELGFSYVVVGADVFRDFAPVVAELTGT
ncbi:MAG: TIGR03621 family F420-dependent LLM class oxidoreductase [Acidimicrobiales bacterium]